MADQVTITVDAKTALNINDHVMDRMTGQNLERFLRGPAHDYFAEEIGYNFEGQGYNTGRWESLHSATQDMREAAGFGATGPINRRSGELYEVLTTKADYTATGDGAEMSLPGSAGASGPVAQKIKTAQQGRSDNPIPEFGPTEPRPVFGMAEHDAETLLTILSDWIAEDLGASLG